MKLSLKEFFVHEAKSSGSDKKSSINIDVKSSAQVNIKEAGEMPAGDEPLSRPKGSKKIKGLPKGDEPLKTERALSSYEHPRTHLHAKFAKNPDIKEPWALAQHIASKNEASACSSKSSMSEHQDPTEPVDAGSTIWSDPTQPVKVKKFSSKGGNLSIDLCEMFGIDEMGGQGSGRKKGSKNKPKPGDPVKTAVPADPASLPDDWEEDIDVSDLGSPASSAAPPPQAPEGEIDWSNRAGFGDEPDDLSWLDDPALGKGVEMPKAAAAPAAPAKKEPPMAAADYAGPVQYSPEFEKELSKYDFSTPEPKDKGQFWRDIDAEDGESMSWEDLEAQEPDIAADIAQNFPDIADPGHVMDDPKLVKRERGTMFTFNKAGDLIMRAQGSRYKWDAENADWIPMDDGESPSGEF